MGALIRAIATFLVKNWKSLNGFTRFALSSLAGTALVQAIIKGFETTVTFLSHLSSYVIHAIAHLLGL